MAPLTGHLEALEAIIAPATLKDFKVSLLLNAVLRESRHVASQMRADWHPSHVPYRWRQLERSIAGWPLVDGRLAGRAGYHTIVTPILSRAVGQSPSNPQGQRKSALP